MRLSSTRVSITSKTTGSTATPPDDVSPTFVSAATNTAGTLVILTYNEALSSTTAATSAFAVTRAGAANAVTAVAVSGSTVELTVTDTIETGNAVTVAYTDPSGSDDANAIQDTAGNDAATLGSTSVTNNSTVAPSAFNQAELSLRYHMHGSAMGIMRVYWESGGTYTELLNKVFEQHASPSAAWTLHETGTTLHNKDGETGNIVVVGQRLSSAYSNTHKTDMALCELSITTQSGTVTLNNFSTDWKTATTVSSTLATAQTKATTVFISDTGYVWRLDEGPTPSTGTGPDRHHDDNDLSVYMYFEGSNLGDSKFATLRTASTITL